MQDVGQWTAQMLLIFWLHRWNVLPADDLDVSIVRITQQECHQETRAEMATLLHDRGLVFVA
jgi:3-methyladenine DNA glycosylase/8-oxoguanine DNA glycosylase